MNAPSLNQAALCAIPTRIATGGARRAGWQYAAVTACTCGVRAARIDARSLLCSESLPLHDRAVVSGQVRLANTRQPNRAEIAAGHESARLAAKLAFFRSRSTSRWTAPEIGRLRV